MAGLAAMATLLSWEFLICGFMIGYLPASWFAVFGPISWLIFVFAIPIVNVYTLAMIVGRRVPDEATSRDAVYSSLRGGVASPVGEDALVEACRSPPAPPLRNPPMP